MACKGSSVQVRSAPPSVFASLRRDCYNRAGRCDFNHAKRMSRRSAACARRRTKIMFYVYILQSINFPDNFYIGYTDDLKRRIKQHNYDHVGHTDKYKPWRIKDYFAIDDEDERKGFEDYRDLVKGLDSHYDTPLTIPHEIDILKEFGFSDVEHFAGESFNILISKK